MDQAAVEATISYGVHTKADSILSPRLRKPDILFMSTERLFISQWTKGLSVGVELA